MAVERLCHPSCGADHLGVGGRWTGRSGCAHCFWDGLQRGNGERPNRSAVRRRAISAGVSSFSGKEVIQGLAGLFLSVDFAFLQPFQQFSGLDVHQFHLVGGVEEGVRDPFGDGDPVMEETTSLRLSRCWTLTVVYTWMPPAKAPPHPGTALHGGCPRRWWASSSTKISRGCRWSAPSKSNSRRVIPL